MAEQSQAAQATVKKSKKISMVWFIPILALALGAWLVYKNKQEQGPLITIEFDTAAGLEAGKTKIKYKDVQLGLVEVIDLKEDLTGVVVSARMDKETHALLNENTKFWVVKPRVGIGGVSGLGTLLSGAYIGIDSSEDGKPSKTFIGLESPPPRDHTIAGTYISLIAEEPGSLHAGSPIYYKQFNVGEIDSVSLSEDFSSVDIKAFIKAPYDRLINKFSDFWNVSGISAELSANGITVDLQSIESLISGGIAFDSPADVDDQQVFNVSEHVFRLYENKREVGQRTYSQKEFYILNFDQSIRGLNVDAPVDYRGIQVGRVVSIDVQYDEATDEILIPVLIEVEPERVGLPVDDTTLTAEQELDDLQQLIDDGFRAKLQSGNLLTGQLFVSLDIVDNAKKVVAKRFNGYPEIPTISTDLGQITQNFNEILEKVNKLEIEKIVENVDSAVSELRQLLGETDKQIVAVLDGVDKTLAGVDRTLREARKLMQGLDEDSITRYELNVLFKELQEAARSVRTLVETIEENPSAVIFGKSNQGERQ